MTKENSKKLYEHFKEKGMIAEADALDKEYNFSSAKEDKIEEEVKEEKKAKK